ncbi:MAG: ISNCY family transposase [Theionarchaea archaeon]|nr:ISNCY family transposase [Theionarchaea archaeon]
MRITKKEVQDAINTLKIVRKKIFEGRKPDYSHTEWEQKRKKVNEKLRKLYAFVDEAVSTIAITHSRGRPRTLDLAKRTILFLFTVLINKSNRDTAALLEFFEPFFGFKVNYKYIERLYSDEQVKAALHNIFYLLLVAEGISGKFAGDGTGYSLTITKHYRSTPQKKAKDYRYAFRLIDLETGMYTGVGYSTRSEMDAFNKAMSMLSDSGISITSIALDKYYSSRKVLKLFGEETAVYVIPKNNISRIGPKWAKIFKTIMENPVEYLEKYFQRNLSETGFSADKRRFGWTLRQKREDRQETAMFSIALLHNIFAVRVST